MRSSWVNQEILTRLKCKEEAYKMCKQHWATQKEPAPRGGVIYKRGLYLHTEKRSTKQKQIHFSNIN